MDPRKKTLATFYILVAVFIGVTITMLTPLGEYVVGPLFMFTFGAIFVLLGVALIIFTVKSKLKGKLRKFLILTGASTAGFTVFAFLHNVFYAFAIVAANIPILKQLMEVLHVAFFLIGVLACPLGFLIGMIGSIILLIKKK